MKNAVIGVLMLSLLSGCTGTFQLTRKVYNFHRSQPDKWMDEIMFLVVAWLPVYGLATTADALIFNSIEFWTGENPITTADADDLERTYTEGEKETTIAYNPETDQISVVAKNLGETTTEFVLERSDEGVTAKDAAGNVMFQASQTDSGAMLIFDSNARLVREYSPDEVASLKKYGAEL